MNTGRAKKMRRESADHSEYAEMKKAKGIAWIKNNVPKVMPIIHKKRLENHSLEAFREKRRRVNERKRKSRMGIGHKKTRLMRDGLL